MTDSAPHLTTVIRDIKRSPRAMRKKGFLPANISGLSKESLAITCSLSDFHRFLKVGGETGLLYLDIEGKKAEPAVVEEIQLDPRTDQPLHVAFRRVNLQEKIEADVPLEFVGYEDIPDANLIKIREEVEIEALPADIPEHIEVDLSGLTKVGQSFLLKDLKIDKSKISLTIDDEDLEKPIALVQGQAEEVEPEVVEETEAGGEVEKTGDGAGESAKETDRDSGNSDAKNESDSDKKSE